MEKRCKDCEKYKPTMEFYSYKRMLTTGPAYYLYPYCKDCHHERSRLSDAKNPKRKNERSRRHYWRNRDRVLNKMAKKYAEGKIYHK